jgi:cardiolipin synthase
VSLPNILTLTRILLIPAFATLFLYGRSREALAAFVIASITDVLDGAIARRRNLQSGLGSLLDPLADKGLLLAAFAVLASVHAVPLWALITVCTREIVIVAGWTIRHLLTRSRTVEPSALGKATTVAQVVAVTALLVHREYALPHDFAVRSLDVAMALTAISGLDYLYRGLRELEPRNPA